jgi:hypothetical protein
VIFRKERDKTQKRYGRFLVYEPIAISAQRNRRNMNDDNESLKKAIAIIESTAE